MAEATDGHLVLDFVSYDTWNWELVAAAESKGFSGRSADYFSASDLVTFADRLARYPLDEPVALTSAHEHIRITVRQVSGRGQIGVVVRLAETDPGRPEAPQDVRLELLTTYERVRIFSVEISTALSSLGRHATLVGERML